MQPQPTVQKSGGSRVAMGCVMLFALPFLLAGLASISNGVRHAGKAQDATVQILVGSVFAIVGLAIFAAAAFGFRTSAKQDELKSAHPDQPWMWREDWARGVSRSSAKVGAIAFWIFALVWNGISFPAAFLVRNEFAKGNKAVLFVLIFPIVGVFMIFGAIYQSLKGLKFGTSTLYFDRVPLVPGRSFRGEIELHNNQQPANGYHVKISSMRSVTSGSGKNRSTHTTVLWDEERVIDAGAAMRSPVGTRVPFEFAIPPDAQITDESDTDDRYTWSLNASAELPGVDFNESFELPVYQTGEKVDGHEYEAFQEKHRVESRRMELSPASGVSINPLPTGGAEFRITPKRTFGNFISSLIFLAVWTGAIWAMIHFGVPWGFPAVFALLDVVFIISTLDYYIGNTAITVDRSGMRINRSWVGISSSKMIDANEIESIDGASIGSSNKYFGVTLKLRSGQTKNVTGSIPDRQTADITAAKMMADLGRTESQLGR